MPGKIITAGPRVKVSTEANHALVAEYVALRSEIKELEERRKELQSLIRPRMKDGVLIGPAASIVLEERKSYAWELPFVKKYFGKAYENYLKVDNSLVSEVARKDAKLMAAAEEKVIEAFTVKPH